MSSLHHCSTKLLLFIFSICNNCICATAAFHTVSWSSKEAVTKMSASSTNESVTNNDITGKDSTKITILGLGSLLSERSARTTFPNLSNFRLGRVPNYRRVFGHPASIFFSRGIANMETKEISSLSAEYVNPNDNGEGSRNIQQSSGFICSIFEVPNDDMMHDGIPSRAFMEREEEFNIIEVEYIELESSQSEKQQNVGILCTSSTDEAYIERWGKQRFEDNYRKYGIERIWGWPYDSGLRPCAVYLRHCYLAAKSMGEICLNSFLDETYLVDRTTTVRQYLEQHPEVLSTMPPESLVGRYSG